MVDRIHETCIYLDFVTQLLTIFGEHLSLLGGQGRSQGLGETVAS